MGRRAGGSGRSPGRADDVPQGKEVLAGNTGQIRITGLPRHSTETWACTSHQSPSPTWKGTSGASAGSCSPPVPGSSRAAQYPQPPRQTGPELEEALPWHWQALWFLHQPLYDTWPSQPHHPHRGSSATLLHYDQVNEQQRRDRAPPGPRSQHQEIFRLNQSFSSPFIPLLSRGTS